MKTPMRACLGFVLVLLLPTVFAETAAYTYDAAGRLVNAVYETAGTNAAIHYAYDRNGNRTNTLAIAANDTSVDSDGDTLPDLDELRYFGGLAQTASGDPDGDSLDNATETAFGSHPGLSNTDGDAADDYHEWVADTDPNNATSVFAVTHIKLGISSASVTLTFPSSASRLYTLRTRSALGTGDWAEVSGQIDVPGSGTTNSLTDPAPGAQRYYEVMVEKP